MMANDQGSSINDAWTKAIASYKRDLDPKQLQTVQTLTSPEEIVMHMERLEKDRTSSGSCKLMDRVKGITNRLVRFSRVVDAITTSNAEASLIWGSLKLLLTIVHQFAEVYERICQSLVTIGESLQVVELLAETFDHSPLVSECVVTYYCSILHFWRKAIKHYRRNRFLNLIRGAWHDYNSEFENFEAVMTRLREKAHNAAAAVDMSEAREARQQQNKFVIESIDKSRTAEESRRHHEIVKWLTPSARDANYYVDDFKSACRDRHPGTCEWIFRKPEFQGWSSCDGTDPQVRMLWVSAIAGAGKTVLAASIIAHCQVQIKPLVKWPVLYFFFKNTDDEKDSILSMTRSLLHQLYISFSANDLNHDLIVLKENSGKDSMLSDERAWEMFMKYAGRLPGMTVVLDALDECKLSDIDELLDRLCLVARTMEVRVIVTSRREENIRERLQWWPCIPIQQEDVDSDIQNFVNAKVRNMARLKPGLRERIIQTLSSRHEGMFLWAFLMIKELKSLATVREVEQRLSAAPKGLKEMHQAIIRRLGSTLSSSERAIALKVLSWVVSAMRPLRLAELHEILRFEIQRGTESDDLLYSEKDLELLCGSLVTTRNGDLQLIHLSTKEILQERPDEMGLEDVCCPFYVDVRESGPRMALLCASYIATHQHDIESYTTPKLTTTSRLELRPHEIDLSSVIAKAPFIEYACASWQGHLVDGQPEQSSVHELQGLLSHRFTFLWLEFRLAQDRDSLWRLERECVAIQDWIFQWRLGGDGEREEGVAYLQAWCGALLGLFKEYCEVFRECPNEVHHCDLEPFFSSGHLIGSFLPDADRAVREREVYLAQLGRARSTAVVDAHRQLLPQPEYDDELGFFVYDEKRDVFYYAERAGRSRMETLWAQHRPTGRRWAPIKQALTLTPTPTLTSAPDLDVEWHRVAGAVISRDCRYLAVLHHFGKQHSLLLCTSIWEIEDQLHRGDTRPSQAWARRVQCLQTTETSFYNSFCPLTIGPDDCFCTPHGLVDPRRGLRHPLPVSERWAAFSGDGRALFHSGSGLGEGEGEFYKSSWLDPSATAQVLPLPADRISRGVYNLPYAVNHNGDYLVFMLQPHDPGCSNAHLMDTRTGALTALWPDDHALRANNWFCVFWSDSVILIRSKQEGWKSSRPISAHRSNNISQGNLVCQGINLAWPIMKDFHLYIDPGSTKAFLAWNPQRIWTELDMRSFPVDGSPEMQFDRPANEPKTFLHRQVSLDGRYLGLVYCVADQLIPRKMKGFVHITDLRRLTNSTRQIRLSEDVADQVSKESHRSVSAGFSADLSILRLHNQLYDLNAATDDMTAPPIVGSVLTSEDEVLFSPCNRFMCVIEQEKFMEHHEFKIYEIARSTRVLCELRIVGARFSSGIFHAVGKFHPHLPILLLVGVPMVVNITFDETGRLQDHEVIEVDLLSLKALKLPPPQRVTSSTIYVSCHSFYRVQFSEGGRLAWLFYTELQEDRYTWCKILKGYSSTDDCLIDRLPSVWNQQLVYDQKLYTVIRTTNSVLLKLQHRLGDGVGKLQLDPVWITSVSGSMRYCACYLLPGPEENDLARVLMVSMSDKQAAMIKVVPVTMKEILAKLDEMYENDRTQQRLLQASSNSQSTNEEPRISE